MFLYFRHFVHFTVLKTVFENSREIVSSANMLATDFSHGWHSEKSQRFFRIEASTGLTSDHLYLFSVDGVQFTDMPHRTAVKAKRSSATPSSTGSAVAGGSGGSAAARRASSTAATGGTSANKGVVSKPTTSMTPSVDPFGASSSDPFDDPFGGGGGGGLAASSQSTDMFDPFSSGGTPAAATTHSTPTGGSGVSKSSSGSFYNQKTPASAGSSAAAALFSSSTDGFDNFNDSPAMPPAQPRSGSATTTTTKTTGLMPPPAKTAPRAAHQSSSTTDPFGGPAPSRGSNKSSQLSSRSGDVTDLLDDAPAVIPSTGSSGTGGGAVAPIDPFSGPGAGSNNRRRSSAAEISADLAGLTFQPTATGGGVMAGTGSAVLSTQEKEAEAERVAAQQAVLDKETASVDPWKHKNLVSTFIEEGC